MHVVGSQWLEDSVDRSQRLGEDTYNIKLEGLEDVTVGERYVMSFHMNNYTTASIQSLCAK